MPMLSALRTLSVGSLLGPQKERQIGWYLQPEHLERVLSQLTPQLGKIGQIILHCAVSVRFCSICIKSGPFLICEHCGS